MSFYLYVLTEELLSKTQENEDQKKRLRRIFGYWIFEECIRGITKEWKIQNLFKKLEEALEYAENLAKDLEAEKNKNVSLVMKCFSKSSCYYLI